MKSRYFYLPIAMATFAFGSCKHDDGIPTGNTPVTLKITDAPANFQAINLSISQIEFSTVSGKKTIDITGEPFNILNYQFGKDTTLMSQEIPSGRIKDILIKFNAEGNQITVDNTTYPLNVNPDEFYKVRMTINDNLLVGVPHTFLIDFDAAKSVRKNDMNEWFLNPVIRTISKEKSGDIVGMVSPASARPKVYVINGTDSIGTITDAQGNFQLTGINQGTYELLVKPSALEFAPSSQSIEVNQGEVTKVDAILLTPPTEE